MPGSRCRGEYGFLGTSLTPQFGDIPTASSVILL